MLHGNQEVGTVDQGNFLTHVEGPRFIGLAGRTWRVLHVDWKARKAHVEPDGTGGKTRWMGGSPGLSFKLAQAIQQVAAEETVPAYLSKRAIEALKEIRDDFAWVRLDHTHLLPAKETGRTEWWTFAGQQVNDTLADLLRHRCEIVTEADSLTIQLRVDMNRARESIEKLRGLADAEITIQVDFEAESAFKFAEILTHQLKGNLVNGRSVDTLRTRQVLGRSWIAVYSNVLKNQPGHGHE